MADWPIYNGGNVTKQYRTPKRGEIKAPNLDYLTSNEVGTIKKLTGIDPFNAEHFGQTTALLGWWAAIKLPEWQGIPFATVEAEWPLSVVDLVTFDDDADDVTGAAQELVENDPELAADLMNGDEPVPSTGQ